MVPVAVKEKKYMRKILLGVLLIAAAAFPARAQDKVLLITPTWTVTAGSSAPNGSACNQPQVGNLYVRSEDTGNGSVGVFRCTQLAPTIFLWQPIDHLVVTTLPAKCAVGDVVFKSNASAGSNLYGCTTDDHWTAQAGGGGGSPAFDAITSGTNTTATMTVGTGASLTRSGTGVINANQVNGTALSGLATGILKNTTTTGVPSIAASSDIINLFSGCSGSQYLGADGACHNNGAITGWDINLLNPNSTSNPGDVAVFKTTAAVSSQDATPNFANVVMWDNTMTVYNGQASYGGGTNAKTTFLGNANFLYKAGAGQGFAMGLGIVNLGDSDGALFAGSVYTASNPIAGDECSGCFSPVALLSQLPNLRNYVISGVSISACNTTITQNIAADKDPQTVTVASTTGCNDGEWIVLAQAVNNGTPNVGATKILSHTSGSITGIFRNNQTSGATVTGALYLTVDQTYYMGQGGLLVNTSTSTTYSTGQVTAISGGGFTGTGTSWAANMVGGSLTAPHANVGAIALDSDDYSGTPFTGGSGPLKSWYEVTAVPSSTSIAIHSFSVAGDGAYHGKGVSGGPTNYIIRPAVRILEIIGDNLHVVCENTTATWTIGDHIEAAMSAYPDMTGFQYHLAKYGPGGVTRGLIGVANNGARTWGPVLVVEDQMATGGNADTVGFENIIKSTSATAGGTILAFGKDSSGFLIDTKSFTGDPKCINWRAANSIVAPGAGLCNEPATGRPWFTGGNTSGITFDLSAITSGSPRQMTWQNRDLTIAGLDDIALPGHLARTLGGSVGSETDLGHYSMTTLLGNITATLVATDGTTRINKSYSLTSNFNGGWQVAKPTFSTVSGGPQDMQLEFFGNGDLNLRIVKTAGSAALSVDLYLTLSSPATGSTFSPSWTSSSATSTVTPASAIYLGSLPDPPIVTIVASLGTCDATVEGATKAVTDATAPIWGATLAGSGSVHVGARCDGTNWVAF